MSTKSSITWAHLYKRMLQLIPYSVRLLLLPEERSIYRFVRGSAGSVQPGKTILDAGAGQMPYRHLFGHLDYKSSDFSDMFDSSYASRYDYIFELSCIPLPRDQFDVILNTQVLEHLADPEAAIREMYRILKPGGVLLLTAPQGWGVHGEPHHYFNFTCYGLRLLFQKAGFCRISIKERGGILKYLGERIRILPVYIFDQYSCAYVRGETIRNMMRLFILLPIFALCTLICGLLLCPFLDSLDFLDKKRSFTLGYACRCVKSIHSLPEVKARSL